MNKTKYFLITSLSLMFITLASCSNNPYTSLKHKDVNEQVTFKHSKEGVNEFYNLLTSINENKYIKEKETFYNVTTDNIKNLGVSLFKDGFANTYLLYKNNIYYFAFGNGGYGFINAVTCDYDNNGISDILYTYSYGSGIHRSEVALFDLAKCELTILFSTLVDSSKEDHMKDLVLEKRIVDNKPIYEAYFADIKLDESTNYDSFIIESTLKKELFKVVTLENYTSNEFVSTKISKIEEDDELIYSKEKWLIASKDQRGKMIDSFLSTYHIKGVSYDQIIELLGEPDQKNTIYLETYPVQFGGYILVYYLSEENDKYIEIHIDSRKIVSNYELIGL